MNDSIGHHSTCDITSLPKWLASSMRASTSRAWVQWKVLATGRSWVKRDGPVHLHEILPRAHIDALNARLSCAGWRAAAMGSPGPESTPTWAIVPPMRMARSDRGSVPTPPTSTTRSTPSPPVCSSAQRSHSGVVAVVQPRIQAQVVGALQLLVAAGDAQHARTPQPRKLQREDRHAAGALDQHRRRPA